MPRKTVKSMGHALRGLRYVWMEELNFKIHCACAVVVLLAAAILRFDALEFSLLVFAILLVLGAEIVNTVIEDAYDTLHPSHHALVGKIKDMMAGLVLLNAMGAAVIGALAVVHHFWSA